jgi:glycopeptide antibiotics resistance protein
MRHRTGVLTIGGMYAVGLMLVVFTPISHQLNAVTVRMYVFWTYTLHLGWGVLPDTFGFVLNIVLFVPLGILVVLLLRVHWWEAALVAVATSCAIELVQAIPALGRETSLADVLSNGIGGLVGALFASPVVRRRASHEQRTTSTTST